MLRFWLRLYWRYWLIWKLEFPVDSAQVNNPALSLLWLWLLLWPRFDFWPRYFCMPQVGKKKKNWRKNWHVAVLDFLIYEEFYLLLRIFSFHQLQFMCSFVEILHILVKCTHVLHFNTFEINCKWYF